MVELADFLFVCFKVQRTHARFLTKETQATKTKQKNNSKTKGIQSENNLVVGFIRLV